SHKAGAAWPPRHCAACRYQRMRDHQYGPRLRSVGTPFPYRPTEMIDGLDDDGKRPTRCLPYTSRPDSCGGQAPVPSSRDCDSFSSPFCSRMKTSSSTPMTILVHQLDSVPSKTM